MSNMIYSFLYIISFVSKKGFWRATVQLLSFDKVSQSPSFADRWSMRVPVYVNVDICSFPISRCFNFAPVNSNYTNIIIFPGGAWAKTASVHLLQLHKYNSSFGKIFSSIEIIKIFGSSALRGLDMLNRLLIMHDGWMMRDRWWIDDRWYMMDMDRLWMDIDEGIRMDIDRYDR